MPFAVKQGLNGIFFILEIRMILENLFHFIQHERLCVNEASFLQNYFCSLWCAIRIMIELGLKIYRFNSESTVVLSM